MKQTNEAQGKLLIGCSIVLTTSGPIFTLLVSPRFSHSVSALFARPPRRQTEPVSRHARLPAPRSPFLLQGTGVCA